ncbi:MAG: hypothetical protein JOZ42_11220 [Acetobacteraceae bacterium]|nr:hypothetical protein [Acetobacteraceae bacterium]
MLPLIGLAVSLVPELIRLIAGDKAGHVAQDVANAVSTATGTTDPVQAKQALTADPKIAAALQEKLADIALQATKAQNAERDAQRHDELARQNASLQAALEQLKASFADTADARGTLVKLADKESPVAYGAPVVSIVVAVGFFVVVALTIAFPERLDKNNAAYALIGTMATAFATMISFWLGSSQSSRNKDETVRQMQLAHSEQTSSLLKQIQTGPPPQAALLAAPEPKRATGSNSDAARFDACMAILFNLEGGYVDNPRDPGGPTNYGITRPDIADFRHVPLDTITAEYVKELSRGEATEIYRTRYWNVMRCPDLPAGVDLMVFQFGVNVGPARSACVLESCVGTTVDGSIGPETLAAVARMDPKILIGDLSTQQLTYYRGLSGWAEFSRGWSARVAEATRDALRMASVA